MSYKAITLDTSIFDRNGLHFERGLLKKLEQFHQKPINLVISEIVAREILKHLEQRNNDVLAQIDKTLKMVDENLQVPYDKFKKLEQLIKPKLSSKEIAEKRFKEFVERTDAVIINVNGRIDIDDLIKKYFDASPPFSKSGKKKQEFPDALALLSLEDWANQQNKKILAVSHDSDWKEYGKSSVNIDVIEDLAKALAAFQPTGAATKFCNQLATILGTPQGQTIETFIEDSLKDLVPELETYAEAESSFYFDPDLPELTYKDFDFVRDMNGVIQVNPIQAQKNLLAIELEIRVFTKAYCNFSISTYDSIDKEYIEVGENNYEIDFDFTTDVMFLIEGDFNKGVTQLEFSEFELIYEPLTVFFGEVDLF